MQSKNKQSDIANTVYQHINTPIFNITTVRMITLYGLTCVVYYLISLQQSMYML